MCKVLLLEMRIALPNFTDMQINKGGPGREQRSGQFKRLNSCTGFISHHQIVSSYQRVDVLLLN